MSIRVTGFRTIAACQQLATSRTPIIDFAITPSVVACWGRRSGPSMVRRSTKLAHSKDQMMFSWMEPDPSAMPFAAKIFLDGGLIFDFVRNGVPVAEAKQRVFEVDTKAISQCDILVIVLDGRSVDEGASFELGFAFGIGKTCVGLKTDARSLFSFGDNPMIEGALRRVFLSDLELVDWLRCFARSDRHAAPR
jgi:hypothetical protein